MVLPYVMTTTTGMLNAIVKFHLFHVTTVWAGDFISVFTTRRARFDFPHLSATNALKHPIFY
jgi:hypothetical protein